MDDFKDLLKSKAERAQKEFQLNTNAVTVLSNLATRAQAIGQEAVNQANSAEEISEKLVLVNKGLIEVIKLCEKTAEFTSGAVHKFQAEINLLSELLKDLQPPEPVVEELVEESVEEFDNDEKSDIEEAVEPTE